MNHEKVDFTIKNVTCHFRPKNRVPWYPLELKKCRTRRLGFHKVSKSAIYLTFWPFSGFWHFWCFFTFLVFDFVTFWWFQFCAFCHFLCFSLFPVFVFCHFLSFFVIFCVSDEFWSIFVTNLSAPMMTHFLSSKPALPLSPLLVVKMWPNFTPDLLINFYSFLITFRVIWVNFDEKLDFHIKNHCFSLFFDVNFEWNLIIFSPFFDPF